MAYANLYTHFTPSAERVQFSVYNSSDDNSWTSSDKRLDFNSVDYNPGGHWSTTNYRFTAPVNGVYSFTWLITCEVITTHLYNAMYIRKNGSGARYRARILPGATGWASFAGTAEMRLYVNDYVEIWGYTNVTSSTNYIRTQGNETSFHGHLVGRL